MGEVPQGRWIGADGSQRPVRMKGGELFEAFHGLRRTERDLGASREDLARAYASAVWAYRCIKLRADAVAGVPLVLVERDGTPLADHPLLALLRLPGSQRGAGLRAGLGDLLRATEAAYNIWGVAYWLKVLPPGARGAGVRSLAWLNPQTVETLSDPARGVVGYRQRAGSQGREYPAEEVIAFRNFDPLDDLGGLSPLAVALDAINAELNASRYVAAFFANDARPAGLLSTEAVLHEPDIERVHAWWERLFKGAANRWKTGIVGGGLKWTQISFPPGELALPDLRAEDRRAICAALGVPPGLAGAWEAATYATAREQKASFYEDTVLPQLSYYADVLNAALLAHYPELRARGARLAWDTDRIAALRETASDRARRLAALYQAGVITRDEARGELGFPALGEGGDPPGSGDAEPAPPGPDTVQQAIKAELARWERFAVKRLKAGRPLRDFRSTLIPAALWGEIADGLASAGTPEDVHEVFGEALEGMGEGQREETTSPLPTPGWRLPPLSQACFASRRGGTGQGDV